MNKGMGDFTLNLFNPNQLLRNINSFSNLVFFTGITVLTIGLYFALIVAPNDYQQGAMVKIMYLHVPSAWLSLGIYSSIAVMSLVYLITKTPICALISKSLAPIGIIFTSIVLISGILWGRPMWGVWWVWDARLTSVLLLFFIYLGLILIYRMDGKRNSYFKIASVYALLGFINIPIVKYSVDWWNTLHQPASVMRMDGPTIHYSMLYPLLFVFFGFSLISLYFLSQALKFEILNNKFKARRIKEKF